MTKKLDLEELTAKVLSELPTDISAEEQEVSLQLFRMLAKGRAVAIEELAEALDLPEEHVASVLEQWNGIYYDDEHRIIGYFGLAVRETSHRFEVDGQGLYTWCAWDTLFIPAILQRTARIESSCPATGETIRLTVSPNEVESVEPGSTVVSFLAPEASSARENIIGSFCHFVHFFSSSEAGERWTSEHEGTFLLSVDQAFHLGRMMNEARYGEVLYAEGVSQQ